MDFLRLYNDGDSLTALPLSLRNRLENSEFTMSHSVSFVGFIEDGAYLNIFFPKRFPLSDEPDHQRIDARLLYNCLKQYGKSSKPSQMRASAEPEHLQDQERYDVFSAYQYILDYFRTYGSYKRKFKRSVLSETGRINWNRTFDKVEPIYNSENVPVYPEFVVNRAITKNADKIVAIQHHLTSAADQKIGWLMTSGDSLLIFPELAFSSTNPPMSTQEMVYLLERELRNVFDENRSRLLNSLLMVLKYFSGAPSERKIVGVKFFWPVWEEILKKIFDAHPKKYTSSFPTPNLLKSGVLAQRNTNIQLPDLIVDNGSSLMILDAKYYDVNKTSPGWHDIIKQSFYAQTLSRTEGRDIDLNGFVFPFDDRNAPFDAVRISNSSDLTPFDSQAFPDISCFHYPIRRAMNLFLLNEIDSQYLNEIIAV